MRLEDIQMTNRARTILRVEGCVTTEDVEKLGWGPLSRVPNCGRLTLIEIGRAIGGWPRNLLMTPYRAPQWIPFKPVENNVTTMWHYTSQPVTARWEYQTIPQRDSHEANLLALNEAGAGGWELCHVGHDVYLMKRLVWQQQVATTDQRSAAA